VAPAPPAFDLITATVGRSDELERFLDSLVAQTYRPFRLIVVDQNEDDRVVPALAGRPLDVLHLHSERGLSHARNVALPHVRADIIAFPDDDCVYPSDLLERLAARFAADSALGGVSGRAEDAAGSFDKGWAREGGDVELANVWHRGISFAIFLRRGVVDVVGPFDERLGLGSGEPWSSGEEIDYLIRAVKTGARVEYDPAIVVHHALKRLDADALRAVGLRDGASVGYLLRKHGYPARTLGRMLVRPIGGALLALAHRDTAQAGFHAATLRGRAIGYRGGRRVPD
jgi:glycosyltransferase involved in cell wall biosynthesis